MWISLGLGKTPITLTSIVHLLNTKFLTGVLVIAPIRVCRLVWRQEAKKWSHTQHLKFSMVVGTKDQRTRALLQPADIYLVNYDCLGWLADTLHMYFVSKNRPLPFNGIVWDEISKMKNSTTQRVKSFLRIAEHFVWATGLTGTPASNGYKDLHGQFLVVDKGVRLGKSKTQFRTRFYKKDGPFKEVAYPDTESTIKQLIGDITLEMSAEEYNKLPDMVVNNIEVEMPESARVLYDQMERDLFVKLDSGAEIEMFNQASLTNKCLAEGTEILTDRGWVKIEDYTDERVWDGEEWVNTSGLVYNGVRTVVTCYGAQMTSDHRVLTTQGWETADEQSSSRHARANVRLPDSDRECGEQAYEGYECCGVVGTSLCVREYSDTARNQPTEPASTEREEIVRVQIRGVEHRSRFDWNSTVGQLGSDAFSMCESLRQGLAELWGKGDQGLPPVAKFVRDFLEGYGSDVPESPDDRTARRERQLHAEELSMGYTSASGQQQANQRDDGHTYRQNHGGNGCSPIQSQVDHYPQASREGLERSGRTYARVYDLANAGPRHRFVARGTDGPFISHNCLQWSNGAVYPIAGMPMWENVHDAKLEALEEIIDEAQGSPILCAYAYRSDAARIMEKFKDIRPINLTDCQSESALVEAMRRWKAGECRLMIGHPASMGHGIDGLQKAGHTIVWFGLNWSLDLYEQMTARIRRQGQGHPVVCHRILTRDTLDQAQAAALDAKATTQNALRQAVRDYRLTRNL